MYDVIYLPSAKQELDEIIDYISIELKAPEAALNFIDAVDDMAKRLTEMPYRHPIYHSQFRPNSEIRFVPVKNYNIFYKVDEEHKTVEVHRIIYQRRDTRQHLRGGVTD